MEGLPRYGTDNEAVPMQRLSVGQLLLQDVSKEALEMETFQDVSARKMTSRVS